MGFLSVKKKSSANESMRPGMQENMPMQDPYGGQYQDPYSQQMYPQDPSQMPGAMPPGMDISQMQEPPMQDPYQQQPYPEQYPDQAYPNMAPPSASPYPASYAPQDDVKERVEEIAEAIIDEKWNDLVKDINKVIEWKEKTDTEIKRLGQEIINLKERFDTLHKGILGKITEYDQNLTNVGTEIKAMEMTFQKILPTFTENVNKLDRLVKNSSINSK